MTLPLPTVRRARDQREFRLHCAVADLLRKAANPAIIWLHIPNGESRSPITGSRLKRMGVRRGAADFHLTLPGGRSAWLELKAGTSPQSPEQKLFEADCERAGASYAVARSFDEARAILSEWGALRATRRAA